MGEAPCAITPRGHGDTEWRDSAGRFTHLPLVDSVGSLGYNRTTLRHVRNDQLLYYREDQVVARELLLLTRR